MVPAVIVLTDGLKAVFCIHTSLVPGVATGAAVLLLLLQPLKSKMTENIAMIHPVETIFKDFMITEIILVLLFWLFETAPFLYQWSLVSTFLIADEIVKRYFISHIQFIKL